MPRSRLQGPTVAALFRAAVLHNSKDWQPVQRRLYAYFNFLEMCIGRVSTETRTPAFCNRLPNASAVSACSTPTVSTATCECGRRVRLTNYF